MTIKVVLETYEDGGFAIYVPSLPGCISEGETEKEAIDNIKKVIGLYLGSSEDEILEVERKFIKETSL